MHKIIGLKYFKLLMYNFFVIKIIDDIYMTKFTLIYLNLQIIIILFLFYKKWCRNVNFKTNYCYFYRYLVFNQLVALELLEWVQNS